MKKNLILTLLIIFTVICATIFLQQKKKEPLKEIKTTTNSQPSLPNQNIQVTATCLLDSCCKNSYERIKKNNFTLAKNGICESGFQMNKLRCISSLTWCEPKITK